eukprot:gene19687-25606_t
MDRYLQW